MPRRAAAAAQARAHGPRRRGAVHHPLSTRRRVRIDLPHGFEFELAEVGSGTSRSRGRLALDFKDTYAQFARLHMNGQGLIRHRAAA
ncbi:hypothetical protein GR157_18360 [Burkholderia sp. 4701]|nr:hypothetical protein [Burkholderia sp. 4701]MXN82045.1 hypothetical protein [Burkholderia sp. 4812]